MKRYALLAALLLSTVFLNPGPVQAGPAALTFNVDSTADEPDATPGDGSCASTPSNLCTLRAAVQEANALSGADTITLPEGSYTLTISGRGEDLAATGDLDILESVTIQGAGSGLATLDASGIDRAWQISSPAVVSVTGLAIQGGDSGAGLGTSGGGIAMASGSELTLEDVTLSANDAGDSGGGIYNNGGTLTLRRVKVVANDAATAAGIHNLGALTIQDSTVAGNHATQFGGGILNTGSLLLERATISGNIADTNGGGLYLHSASPTVDAVTIQNSTISGNQAKSFMGGGIWVYYQTELSILSSTIAHNSAGQGGGIFNYHQQAAAAAGDPAPDAMVQEGNIHLHNSIIANNTFANCGRSAETFSIVSLGHNLDSGTTCELAQTGDLSDTDPRLGPLQDNGGPTLTHALPPTSPAVDQGDDGACPAVDQRGLIRSLDGDASGAAACDIGAFEAGDMVCEIAINTDYPIAGLNLTVTNLGSDLNCVQVTNLPYNHPDATAAIQTGQYWDINGLQNDRSAAATIDYEFNLTLPHDVTPDVAANVCKYLGASWDCARTDSTATTVSRDGITSGFSAWAVGTGGPTALTLVTLSASSATGHAGIAAILLGTFSALTLTWQLWRKWQPQPES